MNIEDAKERVLQAAFEVFRNKGARFTMDDVATQVGMSKKTLYVLFSDKQELLAQMVEYSFRSIKKAERDVIEDPRLTTLEKIEKILCVLPEGLESLDLRNLYDARIRYPAVYEMVKGHLTGGWEPTIALIRQGQKEGVIRDFQIPVLETILVSTIEAFLTSDTLVSRGLSYEEGLSELSRIMVNGIVTDKGRSEQNSGKDNKS